MSLDELKLRIKETPISAILGQYLHITQKGTNKLAKCPFHNDSKPSLHINDNRGMFMCFVDNIGGDAINFVMRKQNLEFIDALQEICQKMGWNFDEYNRSKGQSPKIEMGKKIVSKVSQLYRKTALMKTSSKFSDFLEKRNLTEELATQYSLGYAPDGSAVYNYLNSIPNEKERSFALNIALELGIIREDRKRAGSYYDTFRERIVFPIWDHFGQVIGFTTRATQEYQKAKYMNSVESFLFNKRNLLYGLHLAKNFIRSRDEIIIVEGNMDQIALYKHDFKYSVAIMGVALGESSLQKIKAMTKNIILALDSDDAGLKAMTRINQQFLDIGILPKFLNFLPHKDPDDFLESEGPLALRKKIDDATIFLDQEMNDLIPEQIPEIADRKLEILTRGFEIISPLKMSLSATERIINLAKKLGLQSTSEQIINNYSDFLKLKTSSDKFPQPLKQENAPIQENDPIAPPEDSHLSEHFEHAELVSEITPPIRLSSGEKSLLIEIIQGPGLLGHSKINEVLDLVGNSGVKRYILELKSVFQEILDSEFPHFVDQLLERQAAGLEIREVVGAGLYRYAENVIEHDDTTKDRLMADLKKRLMEDELKIKKQEFKKKLSACQSNEEFNSLSESILSIERELRDLRSLKTK